MMDYKKLAEDARVVASAMTSAGYIESGKHIQSYADAIEMLLETVEAMKNPHIKIQIGCEELTIKEVCDKIERLKKERYKAVKMVHELANELGTCTGCKRLNKECSDVYICECDGEDHWEWEGLDG